MKKKNPNISLSIIMMFITGLMLGIFVTYTLYDDATRDKTFLYILIIGLSAVTLASLAIFLVSVFYIPYSTRRKVAIRALGTDGMRLVRRDEVARLAYKGVYALIGGKLKDAEDYLQKALSRSDVRQNQIFCVEWLIHVYEEGKDNEAKLLWCYRKAVEYSPDDPEAQSRLGHAYFSDGKLDKAMYCFEQALRYDPTHGYSYFSIAKIQMIRGEDEKAFETLRQLVKINENHPLCHAELADYYAMQGDADKAREECKKAQLCGIRDPDELNRRINAMLSFHVTDYDGKDLPSVFYRRIEKSGQTGTEAGND